jgi:pantoate--beta-alanine ligase
MLVVRTVREVRAWCRAVRRTGARLGLVPTMGALHEGHAALFRFCRARVDAVAASVFVNPTQFGPGEDYHRYPRDLPHDLAVAEAAGVDLLFAPEVTELYPHGPVAVVDPGPLGDVLEGAVRPGHFRGVATVLAKLFAAFAPDVAAFGQKDAQQVLVVRRLVRELLLPVEVACMPTVREPDGLALSSRNAYLSAEERRIAPILYRALLAGREAVAAGERSAPGVEQRVWEVLRSEPRLRVDYVAVASAEDLSPLREVRGRVLLLVAARLGTTRLIDNLCLRVLPERVVEDVP